MVGEAFEVWSGEFGVGSLELGSWELGVIKS